MKKKHVDFIHVPHWDELSVKKLWKDMQTDAQFKLYFQDEYTKDKGPCREYFFNILNTIYPDYLQTVMAHASKQRFTVAGEDAKKHAIKATDEWHEALKNLPFKSCK